MNYILEEYDCALQDILYRGVRKQNRTGIDTLSIAGMQCRYDISERFPILTKRKIWPKSIFAELLWFLSGSTNNKDLQALGSNIWTPWVDREFEKKHGYVEGALGPIYGFQLRHFGGRYGNGAPVQFEIYESSEGYQYKTEWPYGHDGFDQLDLMVQTIRSDPGSRRNLFSLWNPRDLDKQKLPCCHYSFQILVENDKLIGILTQRSVDVAIGAASNIFFYSAFIYMLAQQTGYKPKALVHNMGDSHIYINQIEAVETYLSRDPIDCPIFLLNKKPDILAYDLDDCQLRDYNPLPPIKIPVAI